MIQFPNYIEYAVGAKVIISDDVLAVVTAICIETGNHVKYRCVWWDGPDHMTDWFEAYELAPFDEL